MTEMSAGKLPGFAIRAAGVDDVGVVLGLIKELAEYERMSNEVETDVATLRESLFGARPAAEALIGECDGEPVAFAVFFQNFSTFVGRPGLYLEDVYVKPAFRGRGFGRALLVHLARIAKQRGCRRFEWAVLDWNEPAIRFYRELGARAMDSWTVYRVDGAALDRLADGG